MQFFLILFTILAFVFTLIAVHEAGHYLAGLTAGIPASVMKIRLLTFPQHVALLAILMVVLDIFLMWLAS